MIQLVQAIGTTLKDAFPPHRLRPVVLALLVSASVGACSNESMYRAIQENRLQACEEIPIAQQASCKAQYQTDYETYERERDLLP